MAYFSPFAHLAATSENDDDNPMSVALCLARAWLGFTFPNPAVGAVVVKNEKIVGKGAHQAAGGPHAEVVALSEAGILAQGAHLFVTLEPCAHHGRTPPCVPAIVDAGIAKVTIGARDPNPIVDGKGIAALVAAGIEVNVTDDKSLSAACHGLIAPFTTWITHKRPYVVCKVAATLSGEIAMQSGNPIAITDVTSQKRVHSLRHHVDAVVVGANTAINDRCRLTVRAVASRRQPVRVVLSGNTAIPCNLPVFDATPGAEVWILHTRENPPSLTPNNPVRLLEATADDQGHVDVSAAVTQLAKAGITSILVESAGALLDSFLRAGVVDELWWFCAPEIFGLSSQHVFRNHSPAVRLEPFDNGGWLTNNTSRDALFIGRPHLERAL